MKKLYVNGCSFTYGHILPREQTWPFLLSKKLGVGLINQSRNANSMGGIVFNTINHLSDLNSDDTLVVIGLTWPDRKYIFFDDYIVNLSAGDFQGGEVKFKFSPDKISTPYSLDENYFDGRELNLESKNLERENFTPVYNSATEYYKNLITQSKDITESNYAQYVTEIVSLQSFLKQQKFNYYFVDFNQLRPWIVNYPPTWKKLPTLNLLDSSRIINIFEYYDKETIIDDKTSHPSSHACNLISEKVYDSINR